MGHYRSEMISDEEHKRELDEKEARLQRRTARMKELIEKEGLERALAIVFDRHSELGW